MIAPMLSHAPTPVFCSRLKWRTRKQCVTETIPLHVQQWLFDSASLTAKLIARCPGKFSVELISQNKACPTLDESRVLSLRQRQLAVIRQVVLHCDQQSWVYARTVIPIRTLQGSLRQLVKLGNRPLGAVLFADKSIKRGAVEVASIKPCHQASQWAGFKQQHNVWGRRSVFSKQHKHLLVSEFFLPELILSD